MKLNTRSFPLSLDTNEISGERGEVQLKLDSRSREREQSGVAYRDTLSLLKSGLQVQAPPDGIGMIREMLPCIG